MGSELTTSNVRELTSQWDFVTRSIARVKVEEGFGTSGP
ncbi:hypothetical protein M1627_2888 [Sulfolobus islandicus M.16.27]|uniref:Uncharacterized protein n=1 Tax=Saccharolobus islandicus (strain M.16.27) TaxID=427318 RepID=C3N4M7_SACI3|nr:hypothetical protein M1627_2888 [Sulfolobus islandicus M.16.27]